MLALRLTGKSPVSPLAAYSKSTSYEQFRHRQLSTCCNITLYIHLIPNHCPTLITPQLQPLTVIQLSRLSAPIPVPKLSSQTPRLVHPSRLQERPRLPILLQQPRHHLPHRRNTRCRISASRSRQHYRIAMDTLAGNPPRRRHRLPRQLQRALQQR